MNEINLKRAVKKIHNIKMSRSEKNLLLDRILVENTGNHHKKTPYLNSFSLWARKYGWFTTLSILLFFTIAGRSIASTSYRSLPGDPLYVMKVNFIEPLKGSLISTVQGQAQYQAELVIDRLTEVEALAVKDKLGDAVAKQIVNLLGRHTDALASDLEDDSVNQAIRTNYKKRLDAHVKLLEAISTTTSSGAIANDIADIVIKKSEAIMPDAQVRF